ncbi:MAG: bifunctional aspartate transaminase/aspartate 4-decarboxylase [Pseudomonadota bacterium]
MPDTDFSQYADLSPFELKDKLLQIAGSDHERMMLNAGRGNPNFLATQPRRAFLRLSEFAIEEAERSYGYFDNEFGGLPERGGIVDRFHAFARGHADTEGVRFVQTAISFIADRLGIDRDDFLFEAVGAALGSTYPTPPRMLTICEQIVKLYVEEEMGGPHTGAGDFSLFATEGGTAAMTYIFQSLRANRLIAPGDKVALGTPIFSPYLEIPPLESFGLDIVDIRMDEATDWQFPASELERLRDPAVKIFCVVNPSNPPSAKLSDACLEAIADIVQDRPDLMIVTDDVYGTFADDFRSLFVTCPRNTLCVYSFSKYFGATGWRLGVIAAHDQNTFDDALAALPEADKQRLDARYSSLTTTPRAVRFIDRLVADSRVVALNHTAGLSTPQQLQMVLFALNGLLDRHNSYKNAAKSIVRDRFHTVYANMGVATEDGANDVNYYSLVDLVQIGAKLFGQEFAEWLTTGERGAEFLFRLADETGVVLLPGKGFEVVDPSVRISLANLTQANYVQIGRCTRRILDEYHAEYLKDTGTT